jgi:hypothetical protein
MVLAPLWESSSRDRQEVAEFCTATVSAPLQRGGF